MNSTINGTLRYSVFEWKWDEVRGPMTVMLWTLLAAYCKMGKCVTSLGSCTNVVNRKIYALTWYLQRLTCGGVWSASYPIVVYWSSSVCLLEPYSTVHANHTLITILPHFFSSYFYCHQLCSTLDSLCQIVRFGIILAQYWCTPWLGRYGIWSQSVGVNMNDWMHFMYTSLPRQ